MLQHFSELIDKVKAMPRTVVCVANADSETVEAARMALDEGLADVRSKKGRPAKEVFADIERKFGFDEV